jgi:hypothetical protein
MEHIDKVKAILFIKPNADFVLSGEDLEWLDDTQVQPTVAEIEAGLVAYKAAAQAEAEAKTTAQQALLTQLGITEEQAKLLLS